MTSSFLFLGTGASAGIPVIGCACAVCQSSSPKNKRLRSSGLLKIGDKRLLIDAGPDFRQMALCHRIDRLDGLLLTHTHYDHIAGIDELRIYCFRQKRPLPCLLSKETFQDFQRRYYYFFEPNLESRTMSAEFTVQLIEEDFLPLEFEGVSLVPVSYSQGGIKVTGYRLGNFAYISDIHEYDKEAVFDALRGIEKLVVSALRHESSPVQFNVQEAISFARQAGARQTWLTHIAHALDHEQTQQELPQDIRMGYDGLEIAINAT